MNNPFNDINRRGFHWFNKNGIPNPPLVLEWSPLTHSWESANWFLLIRCLWWHGVEREMWELVIAERDKKVQAMLEYAEVFGVPFEPEQIPGIEKELIGGAIDEFITADVENQPDGWQEGKHALVEVQRLWMQSGNLGQDKREWRQAALLCHAQILPWAINRQERQSLAWVMNELERSEK